MMGIIVGISMEVENARHGGTSIAGWFSMENSRNKNLDENCG